MPINTIDRGTPGNPSDIFKVGEAFDTCQANDQYLQNRIYEIGLSFYDFGAVGDGSDESVKIQAAINASAGKTLIAPPGTFFATGLTGVNNINLVCLGDGQCIIKRPANDPTTLSILEFNNNYGFRIKGVVFDGNKSNQINGSSSLNIINCYNCKVTGNQFINAKSVVGYGNGITIIGGQNGALGTMSEISNNVFDGNDVDGIFINKEWLISVTGNRFKANGATGVNVINYVFPPVANVSNYLAIKDNLVEYCGGSGIVVSGYVQGGSASLPVLGPAVPVSRGCIVSGNISKNNGQYGIVFQGENGLVVNNVCESNSRAVDYAGGILLNASNSDCSHNITRDNKAYGIDAGGSYYCQINNNNIQFEGLQDAVSSTPINIGASLGCVVSANIIVQGGSVASGGISYSGIDGDGATPFPTIGQYSKIFGNTIFCNANVNSSGIYLGRQCRQATVRDNHIVNINDPSRALINESENSIIQNTNVSASAYSGTLGVYVASNTTTVVPDWAEQIYITGNTTITRILTYSQFVFDGKVRDVRITARGTGYTPGSHISLTFVGGGGAGAAGYAEVDNGGTVIGVFMTNNGSGYTSAPAVTINGSGSGAVGVAQVGCPNQENRRLEILFQGALTVTDGSNLNLAGNLVTTANNNTLVLRGAYGNWYEQSRSSL